jgi:hypothetical protein
MSLLDAGGGPGRAFGRIKKALPFAGIDTRLHRGPL